MYKLLCLLLAPYLLCGQSTAVPLVMYAAGPVEYREAAGGKPLHIATGNYLTGHGTLSLGEAARVELISNAQLVTLDGPGSHPLDSLFSDAPQPRGFLDRFLEFVRRGLDQSATNDKLERAYQKNQHNAQGNISGLGDGGLSGLQPFGGKLFAEAMYFTWPREAAADAYRLRIVDSLTEAVVLAATVRDTGTQVDLATLHLQDGRSYYWEVYPNTAPSDVPTRLGARAPAVAGVRIYFTFMGRDRAEFLHALTTSPTYRTTASAGAHALLTAMELEDEGYLYAADRAYRAGLTTEPENQLLRRTYAAFLGRWNQRTHARQLINSPDK